MKENRGYIVLGIALVLIGVLFLLQNFGVLRGVEELIFVILFGAGGLAFLALFLYNREQWWAVIPGFTLLGLAALIGWGDQLGALGGALFLGAIGLSFWVIYAMRRDFWWAIIPGGALVTLAVVAGVSEHLQGDEGLVAGGIFFLGLAATFALVYLLPSRRAEMKWALIPAGILAVIGVPLVLAAGGVANYVVAALLILIGAYVVVRALTARR